MTGLTDEADKDAIENSIAVVGMSCRFPGSNSVEEYWDFLCSGQSGITNFPKNRPVPPEDAEEFYKLRAGFLSCPIDEFDANFFGISPREASYMDPQQRLFLEVSWEALENSGINPQRLRNTNTGVFLGIWQQDYKSYLPHNNFIHRYLGNEFSASASRISYCLGLYGPAIAIESGCSSSLAALHLACESLKKGEISVAVSGGVNLILKTSGPFSGKNESSVVMSKSFICKTFDESADGFVSAEGCGVLIIKRFSDAIKDNDNILAIIRGSSMNNDGHGTSFGTPNAKAQIRVYQEALNNAKVEANRIKYIEAHGTGTIVGDPIETYAIGQIYSKDRLQNDPLVISSVKTNIGHCESAAGIASLIKMILCLKKSLIPPHLNFNKLNPKIDLNSIPAVIPLKLTPWVGKNKLGAVTSLSMSGTNVHLILQEAPFKSFEISKNSNQLVTLSAKSNEALNSLCDRYIKLLQKNNSDEISLNDIAYSANIGRANLSHRVGIIAEDIKSLIKNISDKKFVSSGIVGSSEVKEIGFLFTGQGSQYFGMGKSFYESSLVFRESLDECDEIFQSKLKISVTNVLWGNEKLLKESLYCQPAIFCLEIASYKTWKSFGISPQFVLGHSVGEFAAAVCAGVLSLNDALKLVIARSELVSSLECGAMLVLQCSNDEAFKIVKDFNSHNSEDSIDIAAINTPQEIVVSGSLPSVKKLVKICGVKNTRVSSMSAFHSSMMDKILMDFGKVAGEVIINGPICGYISGTAAKLMEKSDFNSTYWTQHLRETVRFSEAVKILNNKCEFLVEIGPQPILLGLALGNLDSYSKQICCCPSMRKNEDEIQCFLKSLAKFYAAGVDLNWSKWFSKPVNKINLPLYPFERQSFWLEYKKGEVSIQTPLAHLLLGREFNTPINNKIFFQTISKNKIKWLSDHKVVNKTILPAAVFLEIFLAAARFIFKSNKKTYISIEDFTVKSPLEITEDVNIQTIIENIDKSSDQYKYRAKSNYCRSLIRRISLKSPWFSIFGKPDSQLDKWTEHSVANFSPCLLYSDYKKIDINNILLRLNEIKNMSEIYTNLHQIGYHFGPNFQSIKKAWRGDNEILTLMELPHESQSFICHPIALDALIQTSAIRLHLNSPDDWVENNMIYLPVSIKKFTWYSEQCSTVMYAYSSEIDSNLSLHSETGTLLGVVEGLELMKTSTENIFRALQSGENANVTFMKEEWIKINSICENEFDLNELRIADAKGSYTKEIYETDIYQKNDEIAFETSKLSILYLIRTIIQLNWEWPEIGSLLEGEKWKSQLLPSTVNPYVIDLYLSQLCKYGNYLRQDMDSNKYIVVKKLPNMSEVDFMIYELSQELRSSSIVDETLIKFIENIGINHADIFRGKKSSISVLFPEDKTKVGAIKFYTTSEWYLLTTDIALALFLDTIPSSIKQVGKIRILEVGAGSGSSSLQIITKMKEIGLNFDFTDSDITPFFIEDVKKKLGDDVKYQVLNIEEDPLKQGFAPEQYDLIIAMQVIHSTKNIQEGLCNMNSLLKLGGRLLILEFLKMQPIYEIPFSLLDGWWRFQDFRTQCPCLTGIEWNKCLNNSGFSNVVQNIVCNQAVGAILSTKSNKCILKPPDVNVWIVFTDKSDLCYNEICRLEQNGRKVIQVDLQMDKFDEFAEINKQKWNEFEILIKNKIELIEGILYFWTNMSILDDTIFEQKFHSSTIFHILKNFQNREVEIKKQVKIVIVTRGVNYIGDDKCVYPNGATGWGLVKTFKNETSKSVGLLIDTGPYPTEFESDQIFNELWSTETEYFISFRENKKYVQRLVNLEENKNSLTLPDTDRFKFINPKSGAFSDITIGPDYEKDLKSDEVEILTKATSLNFLDLFLVLKPEGFSVSNQGKRSIGMDISGIVSRVGPHVKKFQIGDHVYGCSFRGGCASHVVDSENAFVHKPKWMTFVEASTIPIAYLTAYICLINNANVKKNDKVLVHVASGGVGLAAIQILNKVGAQIYATAGSNRKRNYLKILGIKYVYDSRSTSFGEKILKDTSGAGISVVLNSLTSPNFKETSLKICAQNARFIEIGKLKIWSKEDVRKLRPDIQYEIVDLSSMEGSENKNVLNEIGEFIKDGLYKSLPSVVFQLTQIREAFSYFQQAKHIGKIVISMPVINYENGKIKLNNNVFNPFSTYIITGGLGGLGFEVTKWMLTSGAKYIILVGRNEPSPNTMGFIRNLNENGANIEIITTDIGEKENCSFLLDEIKQRNLPPLRGILHAAGIINDNFIFKQNWESVEEVFRPKVYGGWYLHELTLNYHLEFFIMFSSMTSLFGTMSQCNHVAANRFLDSLAFLRESLGLQATTINWGAWSDVGAAVNTKFKRAFSFFTPDQGIAYLSKIMLFNKEKQVSVASVSDWPSLGQFFPGLGNYLEINQINTRKEISQSSSDIHNIIFDINKLQGTKKQEKIEIFVENNVRQILNISKSINIDQNIYELGLDSLMSMELKNKIQQILGHQALNINSIASNPTVRLLSSHIFKLLNSEILEKDVKQGSHINDFALLDDLNIVKYEKQPHFNHILLTGATGHLGIYMLKELLSQSKLLIVTCLIRCKDEKTALERLKKVLDNYKLTVDLDRVNALEGDTRFFKFGLEDSIYENLAVEIDAICHCAALSNHIVPYSDGTTNDIRTNNVVGLTNVIKFAFDKKIKFFFHASSLLAVTKLNENRILSEDWPSDSEVGDDIECGYTFSKFVGEKLLKEAESKGLPVICFRYPSLFGDSQNGTIASGYDHAWNFFLACIRVKLLPQFILKSLPIVHVDNAAEISVKLFLTPNVEMGVYNLAPDSALTKEETYEIFSHFGMKMNLVPFKHWRDVVFDKNPTTDLGPISFLYEENSDGEIPKVIKFSPLYSLSQNFDLQLHQLSEKLIRNVKDIRVLLIPPKEVVKRHLDCHFHTFKQ